MELRDLIVTPLLLLLVYGLAYFVRPHFTTETNKKYFIPALTVRIVGAIALGLVYQFYYTSGDTFTYHTHGSRPLWKAIMHSPLDGFRYLFSNGEYGKGLWNISQEVWQWRENSSFFIIRIATFFDLITFSTYSATATLFGVFGFIGAWMLFVTFSSRVHDEEGKLAWACLFIPSVVFWGSGVLKDTITLSCIGIATFAVNEIFFKSRFNLKILVILFLSLFFIYSIKIFILQAFVPALILWVLINKIQKVKSSMLRVMAFPFFLLMIISLSYFFILRLGDANKRYSVNELAETARVTAYDIRFWTGKDAGSGYNLGEFDGTLTGMLIRAPQAINVALFRPYPWEVKNPLMALSSLESLVLMCLTLFCILFFWRNIIKNFTSSDVLFCFAFSLTFAFGVGIATYNFGTLARYKIPLLPFFLIGLIIVSSKKANQQLSSHDIA